MLIFISLLTVVVCLGLGLVLPLLSWARTSRLQRELRELRNRVTELEAAAGAPPRPYAAETVTADTRRWAPPSPVEQTDVSVPPPVPFETVVADATPASPPTTRPGPLAEEGPPLRTARGWPDAPETELAASSLEEAIGGRLMLWVGTIVLVLGLAFFLKYAFENDWITESMRVGLGVAAGLALVIAGLRFSNRGYGAYGQIITGGGLAVLFLSVYAAFSFYTLIGRTTAFALLVLITAGAAVLADRQRALGLALMAVGGGFMTPFLIGGGTDAQVTLFTYDAILVLGTLYLANRQDWPILNVLSFALTCMTIAGWAETYYTPDKWMRTELFLTLFLVLFGLILRAQVQREGWTALPSMVLATGPLLYHAASLAILQPHGVALWVYLIAVTMVTVGVAVRADSTALRWIAWVLVVVPLAGVIADHQGARWLTANLVSSVAVFALHAWAQVDMVFRRRRPLSVADTALQHANGYALMLLVYMSLEQVAVAWAPMAMWIIAAGHLALARTFQPVDRRAALNAVAVALGAITVALTIRLDGPWLTVALGIEGTLVTALGLRFRERGFRVGGALLLAAAVVRYVVLSLPETPAVFRAIGNEAFIMGLVLAALLYVVGWLYRRAERQDASRALSGTTVSVLAASVLVVVACSAHNDAYWSLKGIESADAHFASSLALSGIWTVLACLFIGVGLWRDYAPLRYLAMALFGLTVLKVFLVDLSSLGGIYRILGFIGVGLVLLAVSFLYQRGRVKKPQE